MKLSKNAFVAALALNGALGCTFDRGTPDDCDTIPALEEGSKVLETRAQVEAHCASDLVQEDTRQALLTCVYDIAEHNEEHNGHDLLTVRTSCDSDTFNEDLNYVFNYEGDNDVRYCVSNDQDLTCE